MKQLNVSLEYSTSEYVPAGTVNAQPLALPLRVLDVEGSLLAEGVARRTQPANFQMPQEIETVFVRLTWPSGKSQTQRVNFQGKDSAAIVFTDSAISHNEWSAWAVPRLNSLSRGAGSEASPSAGISRYSRVWLRLWQFSNGAWVHANIPPTAQYSSDAAKQLDFQLPACPWLLQVGGPAVPWRHVSLPGGGACRVLLTPNDSKDPRREPLKLIVTSFRSNAETLLEFLARDALRAATSLAGFQELAIGLMYHKFDDPLAAVAAAYFLLRTQNWNSVPTTWFDTLGTRFQWIPDAAIINCIVTVRAGLRHEAEVNRARGMLKECLTRGLPIYAEGLSLLREAASVLAPAKQSEPSEEIFAVIERLSAASAWAGSAFSFYGKTPDQPSPSRFVGAPGRSRPLKRLGPARIKRDQDSTPDFSRLPSLKKMPSGVIPRKLRRLALELGVEAQAENYVKPVSIGHSQDASGLMYLRDIGTA